MPDIKIGDYLFRRLAELGIKTCWGVPGGQSRVSPHAEVDNVADGQQTMSWLCSTSSEMLAFSSVVMQTS